MASDKLSGRAGQLVRMSEYDQVDHEIVYYGYTSNLRTTAYVTVAAIVNKRADGTYLPAHFKVVKTAVLFEPTTVDAVIKQNERYQEVQRAHHEFCRQYGITVYDKTGLTWQAYSDASLDVSAARLAAYKAKIKRSARDERVIESLTNTMVNSGRTP